MLAKVLYTTTSRATGGRDGTSGTVGGPFQVALSTPRELGGAGGDGANPEQLFATGYAACFLSALTLVAGKSGVTLSPETSISAAVGIGPLAGAQGFGLTVELTLADHGLEREVAERVMHAAHGVCPYSNATRGNVDVGLSVA